MLQLKDRKKKIFFYLILFFFLSTQITKNNKIHNNFSATIKNIEVIGLSNTKNQEVFNSLKSLLFKNIFFISKESFEDILSENNLIETFNIKKMYPNNIIVEIKKTDFLAITNKNSKKYYIGSNGKLILVKNSEYVNNELPFVFTKSNYTNFVLLKKIIDKSKFNFEEIDSFYYYSSNRWDFKTKSGLLIKLPGKKILESLQIAHNIKDNEEFKNKKVIDLRVNNRITTY